ncbi:FAD-dependent oxidoreductase [Domibacillus robiginosus]|uniref:FAD-dependent oxidoreductase n=1 Tax=Domibacillus robiginosus TaxID=1071054 RepID=UPI0009E5B28F|nr:FAD-dependent oxidoreductase [Domibacillus robiginosus]
MYIPKQSISYWKDHEAPRSFAPLQANLTSEVVIVGGGITGILTAWKLAKEGKQVVLIEAGKLTDGTTGFTTAKISAQHGLIYDHLIRTLGKEKARLYYEANQEAAAFLNRTVDGLEIDCDFTLQDAYVYITTNEMRPMLEKELKAYKQLGIDGGLDQASAQMNLPFHVEEALVMRGQAQFHPVKFLEALVQDMAEQVHIFEHTRAESVEGKTVRTSDGFTITGEHLVVASHFPFNDFDGGYFAKLHPERSYAIGVKGTNTFKSGMYISEDQPSRSVRAASLENGEQLLIIGGENHPVGNSKQKTMEHYEKLAEFAKEHFGAQDVLYRWSAQDLITLDQVPYIGHSHDNIYVATGYAKWGMTSGTVAAGLITDLIVKGNSRYAELYDPKRKKLKPTDIKTFVGQNTKVAKDLISGKLKTAEKTVDSLQPGEGAVVIVDGEKTGAYRDEQGQCHFVDITCTHMGCETKWNDAERSWDCPCHGSRFSYEGEVLEGPAVQPLKKK